jgi:hypothetical protein
MFVTVCTHHNFYFLLFKTLCPKNEKNHGHYEVLGANVIGEDKFFLGLILLFQVKGKKFLFHLIF